MGLFRKGKNPDSSEIVSIANEVTLISPFVTEYEPFLRKPWTLKVEFQYSSSKALPQILKLAKTMPGFSEEQDTNGNLVYKVTFGPLGVLEFDKIYSKVKSWKGTLIYINGQIVTRAEVAKDSPYYALFHLALFTGMRRSELLALRWQDIDFILSQVSVSRSLHHLRDGSYVFTEPKSAKSRRTVALPPSAYLVLNEHYEKQKLERAMLEIPLTDDDLVFSTLEGKPRRPNTVSRAWTMLAARAGLKVIRLHDARHTHASLMLKQGIHPKIVQERLGHSTIAVTLDTYSHVTPGLQEVAARRFDDPSITGVKLKALKSIISNLLAKRSYV